MVSDAQAETEGRGEGCEGEEGRSGGDQEGQADGEGLGDESMPAPVPRPFAFTIMQIGNEHLERVYREAIRPAIEECGLDAKRVDKHTEGGLLKSEIVEFLRGAQVVVADLTNERPNCYLEVGFCMGMSKFSSLVLTARQDHHSDHPSYSPKGPRVHFDLQGYDILSWDSADLPGFRAALSAKIKRRLSIVPRAKASLPEAPRSGKSWIQAVAAGARQEAGRRGFGSYMEIEYWLTYKTHRWDQETLREAARAAQVPQSGWPIGMVIDPPDSGAPRPRKEGIHAEIIGGPSTNAYDVWAIDASGYFLQVDSLIEAIAQAEGLQFDTRIRRTAEALIHARRLYRALGVDGDEEVSVRIGHHGLIDKPLGAGDPGRMLSLVRRSSEDRVVQEIEVKLNDLGDDLLPRQVEELLSPLFMVFQFMRVDPRLYDELAAKFRVSHPGA